MAGFVFVCPECGSDNIYHDTAEWREYAVLSWNSDGEPEDFAAGEHLSDVEGFDNKFRCGDCGDGDINPVRQQDPQDEVTIRVGAADWQQALCLVDEKIEEVHEDIDHGHPPNYDENDEQALIDLKARLEAATLTAR